MRKYGSGFVFLFLLAIIGSVLFFSDECDSDSKECLLITEVSPGNEAVTIGNGGTVSVDLKGHMLTDGEGKLEFTGSYVLKPGSHVTVSKKTGTGWFDSRPDTILFTHPSVTKSGSFVLADSGDEVALLKGSTVIDSVSFGKSEGARGWKGNPVAVSSDQYIVRIPSTDTDTASDWIYTKPGWTGLEFDKNSTFSGEVQPFAFPECNGIPVLNALSDATRTIDVSIYLITSPQVIALLCQKEKNGIEVRVLAEGTPLGVDLGTELSLLKSLADSGGEVRIIGYVGSKDCRYGYLHNKYAVIDGETVVITSENWTQGNIGENGNRGWGAIIKSKPYAQYMEGVFENDYDCRWGDVVGLETIYPNLRPYTGLSYSPPPSYPLNSYVSSLVPIVSPDNSFAALGELSADVAVRLYSEQMDLGSSMSGVTGETPVVWMSQAASRGADVRFILDSSQANGSTHESYVDLIINATPVQAITVNGGENYSLIHNKGIVFDDSVWLGSVNWTETSFFRNRESAVLICSEEVSDYFSECFLKDFGVNIFTVEKEGLELDAKTVETPRGTMILLSVSGPSGYTYEWSLGNGIVRTTENCTTLFDSPGAGTYTATVCMPDLGICESVEFTVESTASGGGISVSGTALVAAAAILIVGISVYAVRTRREPPSSYYRCARFDRRRFG